MTKSKFVQSVDSQANRYALRCFCVTMAGVVLAFLLNQLDIFIVDKQIMTKGLYLSLGLFGLCLACCGILGLNRGSMKYILMFFIVAITTVIQVMLTYHAVILAVFPIVYAAMYQNSRRMSLYTFLLTVVSTVVVVFGGYAVGLCDANMALLTSQPLMSYIGENGSFTLTQVNADPYLTLSLYFVFPRCVLCGLVVIISGNISRIIAESRLKEEEMRVLAEIDGMTGLYNKSKYLELVSSGNTGEENIAVIFWDVNGLKAVNDNYGHEVGDHLITAVSDCIKAISTPTEKAYRVGGDEFVMILRGGDEAAAKAKIRQWNRLISARTIDHDLLVSAAVGYACGHRNDLEELIKQADKMMYENKRKYHSEKG